METQKEINELRNKQSIMARKYQMTKIQLTRQFNEKARKMRKEADDIKEELLKPYKEKYMDCTRRVKNLENIFLNGTGNKKYKKQIEERINETIKEREKIKHDANKIEREEEAKVNAAIEEIQTRINNRMEEIRLELNQAGIQVEKVEIKEIRNQTQNSEKAESKSEEKNNGKNEDDKEKKQEERQVTNEEKQKDDKDEKSKENDNKTKQSKPVNQFKNKKKKVNLFTKILKSITSPIRKIIEANSKEKVELLNVGGYEKEKGYKTQGFEDMLEELGTEYKKQEREERRREKLHMDKEEQTINHKEAIEKAEGEVLTEKEVKKVYGDQEK